MEGVEIGKSEDRKVYRLDIGINRYTGILETGKSINAIVIKGIY